MARLGWGTAGKMVGVEHWVGTGDRVGFQTHDGVLDRGGVPVIWWDIRHRWGTRWG